MIEETGFFILYLFYGLVFFTLGVVITAKSLRASQLKIAHSLWILALFSYTHGLSEWFELFLRLNQAHLEREYFAAIILAKILLMGLSFFFLLWFGIELWLRNNVNRPLWRGGIALMGLVGFGLILHAHFNGNLQQCELYLRNFVALPAAMLAGFGFIRHAATIEAVSLQRAKNLKLAGYALLLYGVFTGAFPSETYFAGLPIEIYRMLAAFFMLYGIMRTLHIFDIERKAQFEVQFKHLAQNEKMVALGKLSAGIAHEINNPLTNALLSLELLEKDLHRSPPLNPAYLSRIEAIKRNLDRAAKIAGELLFFSHNRAPEMEPLNLKEVIQQTFQLIGSRQKLYDFSLRLAELPTLEGIPWKIEEVLLNLLLNAMEATPQGGKIEVRTWLEADGVYCAIQDQGGGVEEEDLRYIFDPFFTTKEPGKGTGLGLSICFGIMELHGGEIHIESKPEEGATVSLRFPLAEGKHS